MPPTLADIRHQAIVHSLFPPTGLAEAVERLGFVQADPICAPARAQDLILRHRVRNYRVEMLHQRYPALNLAEDFLHVYGFMPAATMRLLYPRVGEWRVEKEYPGLADAVLAYVREHGPSDHRGLEEAFGRSVTRGNWGTQAKATTKALELLHYRGLVRVASRSGNVRVYAPAMPPVPELEPVERLRRLVLLQARFYAPVPAATLRMIVRPLRWAAPSLPGLATAVTDLLKSGDLESADVEGVRYVWPAGEWTEGEPRRRVSLLAPFDPVVWDRTRFEHLFGWPYRFEAYTPPQKRQWGYYTLPLLWIDQVVGWAQLSVNEGRMQARIGFVHGQPKSRVFHRELAAELERMATFLGVAPADAPVIT